MELFYDFNGFQLLFSAFFRLFWLGLGCCFGNFCGFSYFFLLFSGFWAGFRVLFWEFLRFQLLFYALFRIFGGVWGAVLVISAVSATFLCSFPVFWRDLGCCFGNFCGFSYFFLLFSGFLGGFGVLFWEFLRFQLHKARLLCYQPMAIVHYDN